RPRKRLEVERREAAHGAAPARALLRELGTGEREHEDRIAARPVEQVLEEVEEPGIRPLEILEDEDRRRLLGEPLEQDPPGGEQVLLVSRRTLLQPEEVSQPRLDPAPFVGVRDVARERFPQLRAGL